MSKNVHYRIDYNDIFKKETVSTVPQLKTKKEKRQQFKCPSSYIR